MVVFLLKVAGSAELALVDSDVGADVDVCIEILTSAAVVSSLSTHLVAQDRRRAAGTSQSPQQATISESTSPNSVPPRQI